MRKRIYLIVFFAGFINFSCRNGHNEKHVELIGKALGLIERGSIDSLKSIIDTGYIYDLYSKEGFEARVLFARKKIIQCPVPTPNLYKVTYPLPQTVQYTLEFCRSKNDNLIDSFDVVFRFFDYKHDGLIGLLDLRNYARPTRRNEPPSGL